MSNLPPGLEKRPTTLIFFPSPRGRRPERARLLRRSQANHRPRRSLLAVTLVVALLLLSAGPAGGVA